MRASMRLTSKWSARSVVFALSFAGAVACSDDTGEGGGGAGQDDGQGADGQGAGDSTTEASTTTGEGGTGGATSTTSTTSTAEGGAGGGTTMICTPGEVAACPYTGPAGTENVGPCVAGTHVCLSDGMDYGPCSGEVLPTAEACGTTIDDDCNGQINDGCACTPGSQVACYNGPGGTQNVGVCVGGTATCNGGGTGYGACVGEVLPGTENCATAADENCDGLTPACPSNNPIIDLRADNNRNGTVDLSDPTEDANEHNWSQTNGAIFLANIDDDQLACPTAGQTDAQLAACNDASDSVTNGPLDLEDLARLKTVPWPMAPTDASATISLSTNAGTPTNFVRIFKKSGSSFTNFNPSSGMITAAELQAGVELAIEGKDFVRNPATWDGFVTITLNVNAGTFNGMPLPDGADSVEMRIAPVLFRHHLDEATRAYVTNINSAASLAFRTDLADAVALAGVPDPTIEFAVNDQWTQDFFETAYMSMPAPSGGQKVIHVNFRSANYTNSTLRAAGKVVFTVLRGVDVAGAVSYDPAHPNGMDTLNSFGNLETIPPYTYSGTSWPNGRVVRGSTPSFYPDPVFNAMVNAQGEQDMVLVDTEWLLVAHIDETISFVKAPSPRGWVLLVADPALAVSFFQQLEAGGYGNTDMFVGKYWSGAISAQISVSETLDDTDVMNTSAWAATEIDGQIATLAGATGLTSAEIVSVPFLFQTQSGYAVAFQPGTVNGVYLSDGVFGPPDPHGPVIGGVDVFKDDLEDVLAGYSVDVSWIEDWDLYHRLDGEVHCGTNVTRAIPTTPWWQ